MFAMFGAAKRWQPLLLGVVATSLLTLGIAETAWPWIVDDAFISLRYAERLVAGQGLTWTDGERVEGYSNLLWVLLTAALGCCGCDWIAAVRVLGIASSLGTFAVLLGSRLLPEELPARLAVAVLAALGTTSVWAIGGLEVPLLMLLVAIAMAGLAAGLRAADGAGRRGMLTAGVALALAAWTRPDGPLWSVVAAGALLLAPRSGGTPPRTWARLMWLLGPPIAAVALQLAFRVGYYDDWLPNTGRAKVTPSANSSTAGLHYVASAAIAMRALLLPAAIGMVALVSRRTRAVVLFAAVGSGAWWLYILLVGGDLFPRSRLLVPSLAPLTVLAAHGFAAIARLGRGGPAIAGFAAIALVGLAHVDARTPVTDSQQKLSEWEWLGIGTGEWLGRAFAQQQPLVAVDAAGGMPFASRLPCLDMLGLCDRTIARTPFDQSHGFVPGHNRANGPYVLSRRPDMVLFGLPPGSPQPQWLGGRQMEADPTFLADYRVLLFQTGELELGDGTRRDLRITAWSRLQGRIGMTATPAGSSIPGYWLGSYRQLRSHLTPSADTAPAVDPETRLRELQAGAAWWIDAAVVGVLDGASGKVVGEVRKSGRHVLRQLPIRGGDYRLSSSPLPAGVQVSLADANGEVLELEAGRWRIRGRPDAESRIDLVCDVPAGTPLPFSIEHFTFDRAN